MIFNSFKSVIANFPSNLLFFIGLVFLLAGICATILFMNGYLGIAFALIADSIFSLGDPAGQGYLLYSLLYIFTMIISYGLSIISLITVFVLMNSSKKSFEKESILNNIIYFLSFFIVILLSCFLIFIIYRLFLV
ncbi:MAG TPA: hypothetical protein PLD14_02815 [Candidatus Pacearchaeota archaeon]|nr:hypothetical protein [Candidatus Pacearchaeota archaeon]HPR80131.1 hypothetical protein [Candidatus Pacearchaeota archaeon]